MSKFLGLDVSTQSLTVLVLDLEQGDILRHSLNYDQALPHYGTVNGVRPDPDPNVARADPLMWAEALDLALAWLNAQGLSSKIRGVSVSAQQHGSVYLNQRAAKVLAGLDPQKNLAAQMKGCLSRPYSPIWMDTSTGPECGEIDRALGGGRAAARLTGSAATERFAGPQIRRFHKRHPELYAQTAHIALISSFITSLLLGRMAPLDGGDGLGMNLADAGRWEWSQAAMGACAPGLEARLPRLLKQDRILGPVSPYFHKRHGLDPGCQVALGTGDNPASLAGLGLVGDEHTRAISLGTSDTYFGYSAEYMTQPRSFGHIFGAADGGYMFLLCFKNGSLARDQIRREHGLSWERFSQILLESRPGNQGKIMLPWFAPEITPVVPEPGAVRYGGLDPADPAGNVRAVAEAQIMSMYLHSAWTGARPREIMVTAGGSANRGLLSLIAQVFGAKVRTIEVADSAALGAALRAAALEDRPESLGELARNLHERHRAEVIQASPEDTRIYQGEQGLLQVYRACQEHRLAGGEPPDRCIEAFRRRYA